MSEEMGRHSTREIDAARDRYAEQRCDKEDARTLDLDAAKDLVDNLVLKHPELTMAWLRATADHAPL